MKKRNWKWCLQNGVHFVLATMRYMKLNENPNRAIIPVAFASVNADHVTQPHGESTSVSDDSIFTPVPHAHEVTETMNG